MNAHLAYLINQCTITNAQFKFVHDIFQLKEVAVDISDDWTTATLHLPTSHSTHIITLKIEILKEYPVQCPIFTIDLDLDALVWNGSLFQAITDIKTIIGQLEPIWRELKLLDSIIETLDKSTTLRLMERRIPLEDNVILVVTFRIGLMPVLSFTGNMHNTKRYTLQTKWNMQLNAIENIESMLRIQLPKCQNKVKESNQEEVKECGICYLEGDEIECKNQKCKRYYHASCFLDWIRVAESKVNLFSIAQRGKCIYCQEWIYVE